MDGNIRVTFASLEALSGDIGNRVGAIEGLLGDLDRQIQTLSAMWEGSANEGFVQTKNTWYTAAEELKTVLAKIQTAVQTSTDGYRDTEDRNAKRWH